MNIRNRSLLIATLASVLALPTMVSAQEEKPSKPENDTHCWGINACKGTGSCSATGRREDGCSGSNACRGQGFLRIDPDTCLKIQGGRLTKNVAKPVAKKKAAAHKS